jgi:leucyl-tRNA synthetase
MFRVWSVVQEEISSAHADAEPSADEVRALERKLHQTIVKVTDDFSNFRFNTAIAALMELNNTLIKAKETAVAGAPIWEATLDALVLMLAPIFPHISEELWYRRGHTESVHLQRWPVADLEKAKDDEITVVVQVNGKVRDKLTVAPGTPGETLEKEALASENVQKWIDGKQVRKVVVVPNKLVNVVIG